MAENEAADGSPTVNKRVSFGDGGEAPDDLQQVQQTTYVYEAASTSEPSPNDAPNWKKAHKRARDDELHKERVIAGEAACVHPIQPPLSTTDDNSTVPSSAHVQRIAAHGGQSVTVFSPPLPSLSKMDAEENPFRPERPLYHEVDPIVEKYKTKSGMAAPDPRPEHTPAKKAKADKSSFVAGLFKSKNGDGAKKRNSSHDAHNAADHADVTAQLKDGTTVEVKEKQMSSPKAGHVEFVHVDEAADKKQGKKACCKCSIQ